MKFVFLYIILTTVQLNGISQNTNKNEFTSNYNILDNDSIYWSSDSTTIAIRDSAQLYMEKTTGIVAKPWVNYLFVRPYRLEDMKRWKSWGIANGLLVE